MSPSNAQPLPDRAEFRRILEQKFGLKDDAAQKRRALDDLERIIRSKKINLPADFDYKEELAKYRDERYGELTERSRILMSPLRQRALEILETMPEEELAALIQKKLTVKPQPAETISVEQKRRVLEDLDRIINAATQARLTGNQDPFERLLMLCKPVPDFDEKKALEEYYGERYGEYTNLG